MSVVLKKHKIDSENKKQGYTLIEVMIAIVILAVGILAIGSMQITAIRSNAFAYATTDSKSWITDRIETLLSDPLGYDHNPLLGGPNIDPDIETDTVYSGNDVPLKYQVPACTVTWEVRANHIMSNTKMVTMTINRPGFGIGRTVQFEYVM